MFGDLPIGIAKLRIYGMQNIGKRHFFSSIWKIIFIVIWLTITVTIWFQFSMDSRAWEVSELRELFLWKMFIITFPLGPIVAMGMFFLIDLIGNPQFLSTKSEYLVIWALVSGIGLIQWFVLVPWIVSRIKNWMWKKAG